MDVAKSTTVDKFDGANFRQWKFQIKCALRAKGLDINIPKPELDWEQWNKDDGMAMFIITSAMDFKQIALVENCETALELMTKLESVYEQKSEFNKMLVHEKFYQYKMSPSDSMAQHISKIESLAQQLKDNGEKLSETAIITKIISTLPVKYRSLRQAWMSLDPTKQTLHNLTARLLDEEINLETDEQSEMALVTSQEKCKAGCSNPRLRFICYNCGKRGHFAKECRAPKKNRERNPITSAFHISNTKINDDDEKWILDSGASAHMCYRKEFFQHLQAYTGSPLKLGNQEVIEVCGQGDIIIKKCINNRWETSILNDVLYVPSLSRNLFSEGVASRKGYKIVKIGNVAMIYKHNNLVLCGTLQYNNLYELNFKTIVNQTCNLIQKSNLKTWHERLGHINVKEIQRMIKNDVITGIDISEFDNFVCEGCAFGKHARRPFQKSTRGHHQPGDLVYSDVCGPFNVPSVQGMKYFVIFKDAASNYRYVFFLKNKCDVLDCFKKYNTKIKNKYLHSVRILHTDNGGEYKNEEFQSYLEKEGIVHEFTAPYTPEQNGRAEREIRTVVESARSMLYTRDLPLYLWAEAVNCAIYLLNRTSSSQTPNISPYEIWHGIKPQLAHVRVFGSEGYVYIPEQLRTKLDRKSRKLILVGYDYNNYKMFDLGTKKIVISRNVIFNDQKSIDNKENVAEILTEGEEYKEQPSNEQTGTEQSTNEQTGAEEIEIYGNSNQAQESDENNISTNEQGEINEPSTCVNNNQYGSSHMVLRPRKNRILEANIMELDLDIPLIYDEAVTGVDSEKWVEAINDELKSHEKNKTWSFVDRKDQRLITSKWVFNIKRNKIGEIEKFKARLCARGFTQIQGIDYKETFAPTTRYESIRILLSISAQHNWEIKQLDIKTAFLYGDLDEDIFMEVPEGVQAPPKKICKLNKSLYGLKQAARCWNKKFTDFLLKFGFVQSQADNCVFLGSFNDVKALLILYVDDALIISQSKLVITEIIEYLKQGFEIKELSLNKFVGLEITKTHNSVSITQKNYIEKIIKVFNMDDAQPCNSPADTNVHVTKSFEDEQVNFPYREAIGSLLFLSIASRPDISYAVNVLSRYISNPSFEHVVQLKRIIRYLMKTKDVCIKYQGHEPLIGYSDSDYAGDVETRRSTTGYLFLLNGGPISWASQKQPCVALSTTEAEFVAACDAAKNLLWLKQFFIDIDEIQNCTTLCIDNQSAIKLIYNPVYHKKTKHIDVKYNFIREKVCQGLIQIKYVPSCEQLADILTKALSIVKFESIRDQILS
jgi:transposase InsO family protein